MTPRTRWPRASWRSSIRAARAEILYEDDALLAVVKPAGLLSIATDKERLRTLHRMLNEEVARRSRGRERVFIVHRLDREVSGVMLFAKSPEVQEQLQRAWAGVEKRYYALVAGKPPEERGTIRSWLRENRAFKVYSGPEGPDAKLAVTHYRLVRALGRRSLLEILLETGRKHQIRVHLADLGCPIVGDRRYGAEKGAGGRAAGGVTARMGLCAFSIAFDHPVTGERMRIALPIERVMRELRGEAAGRSRGRGRD